MEKETARFLAADYNSERANERYKVEANVVRQDSTTYGYPFVYDTHRLGRLGAEWGTTVRHEAAIAWKIVYEVESNVFDMRSACVLRVDQALSDAPNGQVTIAITQSVS